MREQLHEAQEELQQIASQKILLATPRGVAVAPMDVTQCVESLGNGLGQMFDDPRLSDEARAKKTEVEACFVAMRSILATLSSVRLEYEAVRQQAEATASTSTADSSRPHPATDPATGEGGGGGATTVQTGQATVQAGEAAAAPAAVDTGATPATAPVADGPTQDRTANRERTPPPGSRAKAIAKMSNEELAGPRKAKGGSKAAKAGTTATA